MIACLSCGGPVPLRPKAIAGNQPGLCSETCRKAHRKAYLKSWWQANRNAELVKLAERRKAFKESNPDYFKQHYAKNRDRKKKQSREWYEANRERATVRNRAYVLAKPIEWRRWLGRKSRSTRRALELSAFVEAVDPNVVFDRDKGVCGICMKPVDRASRWHVDHVIPLSRNGQHSYANVQLSHGNCNRSKGAKMPCQS